ncbi:MAG: hypothetical protein AAB503_02195 [Patescibacteria group bacterium]
MKKSIFTSLATLLMLVTAIGFFTNQVDAQGAKAKTKPVKEKTVEVMDCGEFGIRADTDTTLTITIWHDDGKGNKGSECSGELMRNTRIKVRNYQLPLGMITLLNGKKVFVYGKTYRIGEGEGSRDIFTEIEIFVFPDPSK